MSKNSKKQPCPACTNAITMGFFFKVCKESLSDKINCKELSKQLLDGEVTPEKVIEKIKEAAKNNTSALEDIKEIEEIRRTE